MSEDVDKERRALLRALRSDDLSERAEALQQFEPAPADVKVILRAALPNQPILKTAALQALAKLPADHCLDMYERIIGFSGDAQLRRAVVERLEGAASKRQRFLLLTTARDPDITVQNSALRRIAEAPFEEARGYLLQKFANPTIDIAGPPSPDEANVVEIWSLATLALAKLSEESVLEPLCLYMAETEDVHRPGAITALRHFHAVSALEQTLAAADSNIEKPEVLSSATQIVMDSPHGDAKAGAIRDMLSNAIAHHGLNLPGPTVATLERFADGALLEQVAEAMSRPPWHQPSWNNGVRVLSARPMSETLTPWKSLVIHAANGDQAFEAAANRMAECTPHELHDVMGLFADPAIHASGFASVLFERLCGKATPLQLMTELHGAATTAPEVHDQLTPFMAALVENAGDQLRAVVRQLCFGDDAGVQLGTRVVDGLSGPIIGGAARELLAVVRKRRRSMPLLVAALRRSSDEATVRHFIEHGDLGEEPSVALEALQAVPEAYQHIASWLTENFDEKLSRMLADGSPDVLLPVLRQWVMSEDDERSRFAVALLTERKDAAALEILCDALPSRLSIRAELVRSIGELGMPAGASRLHDLVEDSRPVVREAVARSLGCLAEESSIETLHQLARDVKPTVRAAAEQALTAIFHRYAASGVPDGEGQIATMRIMGRLQNPWALEFLHPLLPHPTADVRQEAVSAVASIGDRSSLAALTDARENEHLDRIRQLIGAALRQCSGSESFDLVMDMRRAAGADEGLVPDDLDLEAMLPNRFTEVRLTVGHAVNDLETDDLDGYVSYLDSACDAMVKDLFDGRPDLWIKQKDKEQPPRRPYEQVKDWGSLIRSDFVRKLVGDKAQASLTVIHEIRKQSPLHHPEAESGRPLQPVGPPEAEQAKDAFRTFLAEVIKQYGKTSALV